MILFHILRKRLNVKKNFSQVITLFLLPFAAYQPLNGWGKEFYTAELQEYVQKVVHDNTDYNDPLYTEVWLVDMSIRLKAFINNPTLRLKLLKQIYDEADRAQLPPELILAIIQTESAFDHYAVSSSGAQGLMQVMPFWKKELGQPTDNLISIKTNLRYGCTILSHYLKKEKGNLTKALARYNGSQGQYWYPEKVYNNLMQYWQ